MGEAFTVTRGAQQRSGRPVVMFVVFGLALAGFVLEAVTSLVRGLPELSAATTGQVAAFVAGWLVMLAVIRGLGRAVAQYWQLVRTKGSASDVVLAVDRDGLLMADAGCRVFAPWASIGQVEVLSATDGYRLRVVAPGPAEVSGDSLGRVLGRRLSRQGVTVRFTADSPGRGELEAAIAEHSGGRFAAPIRVPAPRPATESSLVA